jgi:hypothetical protein
MTDDETERVRQRLVGHLKIRDELEGVDVERDYDVEVIAAVDMLWCGWECDYRGIMFRMRPFGEARLAVLGGVEVGPDNLIDVLQERIGAYEKAIADTIAFLAKAKGQPVPSEWRWCCTACKTEGRGGEPAACPTCGATNAWYNYSTRVDDTQPAMERLHGMLKPEPRDG